jgi:hypothetical protein
MRMIAAAIAIAISTLAVAHPLTAHLPPAAAASDQAQRPADRSLHLDVPAARGPIAIDGVLDADEWRGALRLDGFSELMPREGATPPVRTEVFLAYDERHLYVAFRAFDDPARIRATLRERDQVFDEDFVVVLIDPHGESNWAYGIGANPLGVQLDLRHEGNNGDPSLDVLYASAGRITDEGYEVEMAIPFSSLRLPNGAEQTWRINFKRQHPRENRSVYTWAPITMSNPCSLCQYGTLSGLDAIRTGGGLEILPSVVASQAGRLATTGDLGSGFENASPTAAFGLGLTYELGAGWKAEGTFNPDFSQIEADAAQIDVNSTLAIQYPERRPFFMEGADLLQTPLPVVYSRSINAPLWAGKVTGRVGSTDISVLSARDQQTPLILPLEDRTVVREAGSSTSNIVRVRHNLSSGSFIGALFSDRRFDNGGHGANVGVDGALRFRELYRLTFQAVGSHTQEADDPGLEIPGSLRFGSDDRFTVAMDGERFGGFATRTQLTRNDQRSMIVGTYRTASPTYRADNGFQRQNDLQEASLQAMRIIQPEAGWIARFQPGVLAQGRWTHAGEGRVARIAPYFWAELTGQTQVEVNANYRNETFRGHDFEGLRGARLHFNSNFSDRVAIGGMLGHEEEIARFLSTPVRGTESAGSLWTILRPNTRLNVQPRVDFARMVDADGEELYSGYIARTRFSYQFSRELSARVTAQYNDFNGRVDVDPLVTYRLNPYTLFYLGSTHQVHWNDDELGAVQTGRQFFLKMQYLFRS